MSHSPRYHTMIGSSVILFLASLAIKPHLALAEYQHSEPALTDPTTFSPEDIIERDVAVIGGGATGTYAALRLKDDNKSMVVIEKKSTLGGHAETYVNPFTDYTFDIGVVVFANTTTVTDLFARFDIPLISINPNGTSSEYVDFATGAPVKFEAPDPTAFGEALTAYESRLLQHPSLQHSLNLSYPVDSELLLSFGEFVARNHLDDLVPQTFASNQGYAPLLNISMLYIFGYLNQDQINSHRHGLLTTVHHNIQELYQKITSYFGSDVLLNSSILAMDRSGSNTTRIAIDTPAGRKLIVAKKIISTVPPEVHLLDGYDLSTSEKRLFSQFFANGYYTGLLNNTGLNSSMVAIGPDQPYHVPKLPGLYSITINQGLTQVYYGSPRVMSEEAVKSDILTTIQRIQEARGIETDVEPDWLIFSSHSPFNLMVSNDAIQAGFYSDLFALQGQRNTFYGGAAWRSQDSSVLWKYVDEYLLPMVKASL
ncbi:FAD/NAD(P)-binding domain-containing protein [Xylariaceae sp. FL0016]|nr:FAD/NAD(P)-binding domain-containing protein [Xylariaceae sp. FL0016]